MRFAPITIVLFSAFTLVIAPPPKRVSAEEKATRHALYLTNQPDLKLGKTILASGPFLSNCNAASRHADRLHRCHDALMNPYTPDRFKPLIQEEGFKSLKLANEHASLAKELALQITKIPDVPVPDNLPNPQSLANHHHNTAAQFRNEAERDKHRAKDHLARASMRGIPRNNHGVDLAVGAKAWAQWLKKDELATWHTKQAQAVEKANAAEDVQVVRAAGILTELSAKDASVDRNQSPGGGGRNSPQVVGAAEALVTLEKEDRTIVGKARTS